jgi:hypothetical protein
MMTDTELTRRDFVGVAAAAVAVPNFNVYQELGKRPKLAISTPPQHGKSTAAEDFAGWIAGKQPDWKTIYASYSDDLGVRCNLNLQRLFAS